MYRLLKDGNPVYEQKSKPTYLQFLMRELKPNHVWSIEIDPTYKEQIKERISELESQIERLR